MTETAPAPAATTGGFCAAGYEQDVEAKLVSMSLFRRLDADSSGFLSEKELLKARMLMVGHGEVPELSLSSETDANSDGVVDETEWHEFCESLYSLMGRKTYLNTLRDWVSEAPAAMLAKTPEPEEPPAAEAVAEAAATKIQKAHRGKAGRKTAAEKRRASPKKKAAGSGSAGAEQPEVLRVPTVTVAELWDLLLLDGGRRMTRLSINDLVNIIWDCKTTGLNLSLIDNVHMHFEEKVEPEDLSAVEVAHLCKAVVENVNVTEQEVRTILAPFRSARNQTHEKTFYLDWEGDFNLKRFRRLLTHLSALMRIDQDYIVQQMQWLWTGCFETTDTLAALVIERVTRKALNSEAEERLLAEAHSGLPDLQVLEQRLLAPSFKALVDNSAIVHERGTVGIVYGDIALIFHRAVKRAGARVQERMVQRSTTQSIQRTTSESIAEKATEYIVGRNEFEVLMEELSNAPGMRAIYSSPLRMMVGLLERAKDQRTGCLEALESMVNLENNDQVAHARAAQEARRVARPKDKGGWR